MTAPVVAYAGDDIDDFALWAREIRETRMARISAPARITLYDGDYRYRGRCASPSDGSVALKINDAGTIHLELPIDMKDRRGTFLAHWAIDQEARGTSNIHVIIEKDGARIGGRTDPEKGVTLHRSPDGDRVILEFLEDTQELKHVHMAAAPFLPLGLVQEPKVQFLFAPVDWGGLTTLGMNMLRLQGTNFNMTRDLLNPANHTPGLWAQAQIVPMPKPLGSTPAPTTIIDGSIKQSWWDVMAPRLEDAEMMLVTRRHLDGDPEPWPGAGTNWRQGTLFVDIVDKSGWRSGTSLGGNLATGLVRSIANVTSNYVEDSYDLITGQPVDTTGLKLPGKLGTQPSHPNVVYRDGELTGVQDFSLTRSPGGPCRITAGGQSMPGVNELWEAGIGYAGDVIGDNINIAGYGIGSLGNIANAFVLPIVKDAFLAYMSVPLLGRAAQQGWGHYLETVAQGVTQAYTPSAIIDLRKRRRETDPDTAFTFTVASGRPWLIGDRGQGHWWLGDRVGATTKYLGARVFVSRCREMSLPLKRGEPSIWVAKFGDLRTQQDALEKLVGLVGTAANDLNLIGIV
ncbi:Gp37-like protein [Williamsia deligens]|uniref:Gp28/Gp37-like domain-containing protein n=1 Tax=Williamsia deligens TaxID=321325 RepID=A0ABW3GGI0_9NOCA|nr:hypothetical protein [Williamsia deligens]MCP2196315.1 hypothetical protein [Williamsia deligens]